MNYKKIIEAKFKYRANRFCGFVEIEGIEEEVHIKNTGRCKELLVEGARVFLEKSNNPKRKTGYSLVSVYKGNKLINMDSQVPNQVVAEALAEGKIAEIGTVEFLKREVTFERSRFDIYFEDKERKGFVEVKGATLEDKGRCMFPDAPTQRGTKHVYELIKAVKAGYEAYLFFLIQTKEIESFQLHWERDKVFATAVLEAQEAGVRVLVYDSKVWEDGIELGNPVGFVLDDNR